jgi:hypothetical protein
MGRGSALGAAAGLLLGVASGLAGAQEPGVPTPAPERAPETSLSEPSVTGAVPEAPLPGPRREREGWALRVEAATSAPVDVSGRATLELPGRLQLVGSVGFVPRPYTEGLNTALVRLGAYDAQTGELVTSAYSNGLLLRGMVGWRPVESSGFYVLGGFGVLTLGGGLTTSELLAAALGQPLPEGETGEDVVRARATLQQLHAEIGWKWTVAKVVSLGAGLGGFYSFGAQARITPQTGDAFSRAALQALAGLGEDYLEDRALRFVHAPYLTLTAGVKLF